MNKIKRSIKPKSTPGHDVSVIIVCRNGVGVTEHCLKGIASLPVKEIIIIDNDSNDGTKEMLKKLKKKDSRIQIVTNSGNNGFAEANNQGYEVSNSKYILFLNNDTVIENNFIAPLLQTLKQKEIAAVQPMILFPDGTIDSIGSYLTPTGFLYHRAHRLKPKSSFLKHEAVYTMKGACMLWKRSVLEKIGVFEESYFAYFEETELCHRAINAGYTVFVNPAANITHLGGFTSNNMNQEFIQFHNAKNRITTYILHFPVKLLFSIVLFHFFLSELLVIKMMISGQFKLGLKVQEGLLRGAVTGVSKRVGTWFKLRTPLDSLIKTPDLAYYKALFTALKGYTKVW